MAIPEERVLAVRSETLFAAGQFQGCQPGGQPWLDILLDARHGRFLRRAEAENDPAWKQVIPYVVLEHQGALLCYQRGKGGGEARLAEQFSIGWGGHIAAEDATIFTPHGPSAYAQAVHRELHEELSFEPEIVISDRIAGLINDDSLPVGRVHIGVVHIWKLRSRTVRKREAKIVAPRWRTPDELRRPAFYPKLESWSRFCLDHWENLTGELNEH
jgi:predicted NUDIX family phosphoesterase